MALPLFGRLKSIVRSGMESEQRASQKIRSYSEQVLEGHRNAGPPKSIDSMTLSGPEGRNSGERLSGLRPVPPAPTASPALQAFPSPRPMPGMQTQSTQPSQYPAFEPSFTPQPQQAPAEDDYFHEPIMESLKVPGLEPLPDMNRSPPPTLPPISKMQAPQRPARYDAEEQEMDRPESVRAPPEITRNQGPATLDDVLREMRDLRADQRAIIDRLRSIEEHLGMR